MGGITWHKCLSILLSVWEDFLREKSEMGKLKNVKLCDNGTYCSDGWEVRDHWHHKCLFVVLLSGLEEKKWHGGIKKGEIGGITCVTTAFTDSNTVLMDGKWRITDTNIQFLKIVFFFFRKVNVIENIQEKIPTFWWES